MTRTGHDPAPETGVVTLIDTLLAEQRQLTVVDKFSRLHEAHPEPQLAPHYRDLIPLTAPRPGEQYAFEVDLDRCSGCKGCVTACHSLNGLDEDESWREVGFLVGEALVPLNAVRGAEANGSSYGPFPLALGETENATASVGSPKLASPIQVRSASADPFKSSSMLPVELAQQSGLPPLPRGEGRGEGEARAESPNRFDSRPFGHKVIPLQQTVTTACHHCVEPGCLLGCPVLAYDKDPVTGIVRHLDDQCIGCSYCILKCPYDVPKYSAKRGIVRKCDMCHGRLAEGEAPACVQACPNEAIRIALVKPAELVDQSRKPEVGSRNETATSHFALPISDFNAWLPDSPDPAITLPTTRYLSTKPNALLRSADHAEPKPAHAHWPLVLMLVLTQAGIGGLLTAAVAGQASSLPGGLSALELFTGWMPAETAKTAAPLLAAVSFLLLTAGLAASVFHLGQPKKAWRVWLGWRTSWLSREAIALNAFAGIATAAVGLLWADKLGQMPDLPDGLIALLQKVSGAPAPLWALPLWLLGLAAVFAQVMVYADTHRRFWRLGSTAPRFFGSTLVLGTALALAFSPSAPLAVALLACILLKFGCEVAVLKHADSDSEIWTQLRRTAVLQCGPLRPVLALRLLLGLAGGAFLPFGLIVGAVSPAIAAVAFPLCLLGELAERYLFFTSVAPDKMPGLP